MTGILLLAHGSREGDTEETMRQIACDVKRKLGNEMVEEAYLQFREKNLEKGLLALMARGADTIHVVPYFLFTGIHIKEDIPGEIEAFSKRHPDIRITMGKTLGADGRLSDILVDRIRHMA